MRQILSILLISTFVVPITPVSAQDVDSIPTLKKRLRNMDAEVERFLDLNTTNSSGLLLEQETPATDESTEAARVREEVHEIPIGKRVEVVLLNGEKVRGNLLDATEQGFTLSLGEDTNQEFAFDEVTSVRKLGMETSTKIVIAAGIATAVLTGLLAYWFKF